MIRNKNIRIYRRPIFEKKKNYGALSHKSRHCFYIAYYLLPQVLHCCTCNDYVLHFYINKMNRNCDFTINFNIYSYRINISKFVDSTNTFYVFFRIHYLLFHTNSNLVF